MFNRKLKIKRKRNSYSISQRKSNRNSFVIKVTIIMVCILTALGVVLAIVKNMPEEKSIIYNYKIFGEKVEQSVNSSFKLSDLMLSEHNTEEFEFSNDDIVILNNVEYTVEEAEKLSLTQEDSLEIIDVKEDQVIDKVVIPFEKDIKDEITIATGKQILAQQGVNGEEVITYSIIYRNGEEHSRQEKSREVNVAVTKEILLVGTGSVTTYSGPVSSGMNSNEDNDNSVFNVPKEGRGEGYDEPLPVDPPNTVSPKPPPDPECVITVNGVEYPCQ